MSIYSLLVLALFFTFQAIYITNAIDTINTAQVLRDGETMISSGGSFELGFFSPGNSTNRYVGIWYNKVTVRTVVWVANRNVALRTNTSGVLRLLNTGILVIEDETNGIIWSTNGTVGYTKASNSVPSPVVRLLDSGNLVVKDANDNNPGNFLWQSFDYPTDTLLPGMRLGWNFVTRHEVFMSSWRSNEDPSPGDFTYHCDPSGYPQDMMRRGGIEQYRTGPWNGVGFSGLPSFRNNSIFAFHLVINRNEIYYNYVLLNSSVISRFMISPSGEGQRWTWIDRTEGWAIYMTSPMDNCDTYNSCGAYGICDVLNSPVCGCLHRFVPRDSVGWGRGDWSNGCVRSKELDCGKGDGFLKYSGIKLPDTQRSWYNASMTLRECRMLCSTNCSCMAYTSLDISRGGSGCLLWYDELIDIRELSAGGQDIYIRVASSELGKNRGILILSVLLAAGLVLLGLSLILLGWLWKRSNRRQGKDIGILEWIGCSLLNMRPGYVRNHSDESCNKDLELPMFDLQVISKATNSFSFNYKLGEGGFGTVYKGILEGGQEIAVKRLSRTSFQGVDEFKNEVLCIAKLQHRNLVKLLGCCVQGGESILVYEYMTNKSLDFILFDSEKNALLNWPKRFHIISGIARGLMYLHQDSRLRIIHRDLKASNVLLDSDMNPKISDFGLARICVGNETGANTTRVVGTYGYMSPEYSADGLFSVKSDVFSFGVLVFEIVTGKRTRGLISHGDHHLNLLGYMWMLYAEGRLSELVDSFLGSSQYDVSSEINRSIHIGLLCVQQRPEDRPTMSSVVSMLGNQETLPQPKQPGLSTGLEIIHNGSSDSSTATNSVNRMSVTRTLSLGR